MSFERSVSISGRPEDWLNDVEAAMFQAIKHHLIKALESSKSATIAYTRAAACILHRLEEGEVGEAASGPDGHHCWTDSLDRRM